MVVTGTIVMEGSFLHYTQKHRHQGLRATYTTCGTLSLHDLYSQHPHLQHLYDMSWMLFTSNLSNTHFLFLTVCPCALNRSSIGRPVLLSNPKMTMIRLTYFKLEGRAEATRLAFIVSGQEFEDRRIDFADFPTVRQETPWAVLPFLNVNEKVIGHSTALLRYAGKVGGLYPEDAFEAIKVDEIVMAGEDIFGLIFKAFGQPPEKQKEMGAEMVAGKLPVWLKALGAKLSENPASPYFVGDSITIADLQVFSALRAMNGADYIPNSVVEDNAPALNAHYDAIMSHPKVKAHYASTA